MEPPVLEGDGIPFGFRGGSEEVLFFQSLSGCLEFGVASFVFIDPAEAEVDVRQASIKGLARGEVDVWRGGICVLQSGRVVRCFAEKRAAG